MITGHGEPRHICLGEVRHALLLELSLTVKDSVLNRPDLLVYPLHGALHLVACPPVDHREQVIRPVRWVGPALVAVLTAGKLAAVSPASTMHTSGTIQQAIPLAVKPADQHLPDRVSVLTACCHRSVSYDLVDHRTGGA